METLHRILAYVAVAAVAVGIGWSVLAARRPAGSGGFGRFQALAVAVFVVASGAGLAMLVVGGRPREGLHLVYAAISIAAIPLARSFVPIADRRAGVATLAVFVVLAFVLYRLFATG